MKHVTIVTDSIILNNINSIKLYLHLLHILDMHSFNLKVMNLEKQLVGIWGQPEDRGQ